MSAQKYFNDIYNIMNNLFNKSPIEKHIIDMIISYIWVPCITDFPKYFEYNLDIKNIEKLEPSEISFPKRNMRFAIMHLLLPGWKGIYGRYTLPIIISTHFREYISIMPFQDSEYEIINDCDFIVSNEYPCTLSNGWDINTIYAFANRVSFDLYNFQLGDYAYETIRACYCI